ncbi:MAG: hypothetical protein AB1480_12465 [Nitrospirota bacterium]
METKKQKPDLEKLTSEISSEIDSNIGVFRRIGRWFVQLFSTGPRTEIYHDWLGVKLFAERAEERFNSLHHEDTEKRRVLADLLAYLALARRERDFAQAWTYVNLADALLPLVVEEKEMNACVERLRALDSQIPAHLMKNYDDVKKHGSKEHHSVERHHIDDTEKYRYALHSEQLKRALLWNILNRRVSLRLSLWYSVGKWLLFGLLVAVADAKIEGAWHGAFTYYFCKEMHACENKLSRKKLLKKIRADLKAGSYTQIPQLESQATARNKRIT